MREKSVMDLIIILSLLISIVVGLILYSIFVPRRSQVFSPNNDEVARNNIILRMANVVGSEIYSALPEQNRPSSKSTLDRTRMLLVRSGNPWLLNPQEFLFMRWVCAFFGLIIGSLFSSLLLLIDFIPIPFIAHVAVAILFGIVGFFFPYLHHNDRAKERDLAFKKELPEALDLILISVSSQKILRDAIRESVENMRPGVLRNEFVNVLRSVDSGRSMNEALDDFADRSPNEGVITFVNALKEATTMNVDITELMQSRAQSSRDELFSLVKIKAAALPTKINVVLMPAMLIAFMLTIASPVVFQLLSSLENF